MRAWRRARHGRSGTVTSPRVGVNRAAQGGRTLGSVALGRRDEVTVGRSERFFVTRALRMLKSRSRGKSPATTAWRGVEASCRCALRVARVDPRHAQDPRGRLFALLDAR